MITVLRQIIFDEFMTYIERLELGNFYIMKTYKVINKALLVISSAFLYVFSR